MKKNITIVSLRTFINLCFDEGWFSSRIVDELITFCDKELLPNFEGQEHDNCALLRAGKVDANCDD